MIVNIIYFKIIYYNGPIRSVSFFQIAIQGRHFAEFKHRLPYKWITNIAVDGDVIVHNVYFKETNNNQMNNNNPNTMPYGFHQPGKIKFFF